MTNLRILLPAALACGFTATFTALGYSAALIRAKAAHRDTYIDLRRTRRQLHTAQKQLGATWGGGDL